MASAFPQSKSDIGTDSDQNRHLIFHHRSISIPDFDSDLDFDSCKLKTGHCRIFVRS